MITHLLKKDIRHSRIVLAMWFLLVVAQFVLIGSSVNPSDRVMQAAFEIIATLVPLFQFLLLIVIIPHVIHDEPLVGTTAFWFTRPISPAQLLKSKTLFAVLILVLLPLIAEEIVFAANGVTLRDMALALPEIVMDNLTVIILIALIAVLTRNFGRFAIAGAGVLIAGVLVTMALQFATILLHPESMTNAMANVSLTKSRGLVGSLLTILIGGGIVAHQYLTRRAARSVLVSVIGVVVVLLAENFWPFDFFKPAPVNNTHADFDIASVKLEFTSSPSVLDIMSMRGKEAPEKRVNGYFKIIGIPSSNVTEVKHVQSNLKFPDGKPLEVKALNEPYRFDQELVIDSLEAALGGIHIVNADCRSSSISTPLFSINAETYKKYETQPMALSADVELLVSRYVVSGELPLKKGARYDHGSEHVIVTDVLNQPGGVDIVLRERKVNLLFAGNKRAESPFPNQKSFVYLLVNKKRREAVQKKQNYNFGFNFGHSSRLLNQPERLSFGADQNNNRLLIDIDEQWLADAVLVRLDRVPVAQFTRQLKDDHFILNDNEWDKNHKTQSDRQGPDKEALAKIEFPQNADKQQVKNYVLAVLKASQKQNSRSHRDPQVDMLAKVGPQNLDVLIEFATRIKSADLFYVREAIKKLARPEDKEMILQALKENHALVDLVLKYNWASDAKETLVSTLSTDNGSLSGEWIKAVASLQDPSTYPDLAKYFVRCANKKTTYDAIKNLPGIDLTEAVSEAWKRVQHQSDYDILTMSGIVADYGNVEALDVAAKYLKSGKKDNYERKLASEVLRKFTPATGDDRALLAWYDENRAKLSFDAVNKKFIVKP